MTRRTDISSTETGGGGSRATLQTEHPTGGSAPPPRRRARWRRVVAGAVGVIVLLVAAGWLYLSSNAGRNAVTRLALNAIPLTDGYAFTFDDTRGSLPANLTVLGARMTGPDGQTLLDLDTTRLGIRLLPLVRRSVQITHVRAVGVAADVRQTADGSWDLVKAFPVDTALSGLSIRIGELSVADAHVRAAYYRTPDSAGAGAGTGATVSGSVMVPSDSVLRAGPAYLLAHDIRMVDTYGGRVDSLLLPFTPPGLESSAQLRLSASWFDDVLQVRTGTLTSERSHVMVTGDLSRNAETARLVATANPIAFADLAPFFSTLDLAARGSGTITIERGETTTGAWHFVGDLDFGSQGSTSFSGSWADDDVDAYAIDLTLENVAPQLFATEALTRADRVSGTVRADLAGPDRRHLDGTVAIDLPDVRLPTYDIRGVRANADVEAGLARLEATVGYLGRPLRVTGQVSPLAEQPTYDLVVAVGALDLSRADYAASWPTVTVSGQVRIAGSGFKNPDIRLTPTLNASRVGNLAIRSATGSVTFANDVAAVDLTAQTETGALRLAGSFNTETTAWQVNRLTAKSVDVMAVTGEPGTSSLSGTATGSGRGLESGRFTVAADSVDLAAVEVREGTIDGEIRNRTISFNESALVNGTKVAARGRYVVPLGEDAHALTIDAGRVDSLDLTTLPWLGRQTGIISATLAGSLRFKSIQTARGEVSLSLLPSTVNGASFTNGSVELEVSGADVRYQFELVSDAGSFAGSGAAQPFEEAPTVTLDRLALQEVDAGALSNTPGLSTRLNGTVSATWDGATSALQASLNLEPSAINGQTDIGGTIRAEPSGGGQLIRWSLAWPAQPDESGESRSGRLAGRATIVTDTSQSATFVDGRMTVEHLDPAAWWPVDPEANSPFDTTSADITLAARFEGSVGSLEQLTGRLDVDSLGGSIAGNEINAGALRIRADAGLFDVEELSLETTSLLVDGRGPIVVDRSGRESAFYLEVNAEDLSLIGELIPRTKETGGFGSVSASVVGPPAATHLFVDGTLGAVKYGENRAGRAEVYFEADLDDDRELTKLDGRLRVVNLIAGAAQIRDTQLQATLVDSLIQFQAKSEIDNRRDASITGTLDTRPSIRAVTILGANVRFDNDRWSLLQPSTLSYGEAYRVRNLLLFTEDQQIAIDGVIDLDGDQSLILTVENFRIGSVADLLGYGGLDGTMNGYLDLVGPADAPIMQGDLNVDLESNRSRVGDLQLSLAYDSLRLRMDGTLNHRDGGTMDFVGLVPVDLRLASTRGPTQTGVRVRARQARPDSDVDLSINADSFSVGWILPFLDPAVYSKLEGVVDGEMRMRGTFAEPLMTGSAAVKSARVGLPMFGIEVRDIAGDLFFEDRNILINNLRGSSGRGRMRANGLIELTDLSLGQFDISFDLEDFLAIDNSDYRAATAGDLLLYGTTRQPVVSGYLRLESLDIYYKGALEEFEPVTLSERDLREVELVFGRRVSAADTTTYDFYTALEIDVNVEMTRDSWLRSYQNPRMDVPFYGSLDVAKQPSGEIEAFGTIEIIENRGRIVELGRRFDIKRGTITYNGSFADPRIDLEATYQVKSRGASGQTSEDIVVNLAATGTLQDLDLTLSSDPAMETTDILSYILIGRPARESLQFGGGEESLAADIALSQAAGFLEGLAGEELGLDVVRIEYEGTEVKLTAGKYLRSGVYVAISQPIVLNSSTTQATSGSGTERELLLEVEIMKGLLARLQQQGTVFGINLFWQYAY